MKTIGMDIGTTTVCAILADAETGKLLNVQTLTNDAHLKSEKSWERIQNPKRILELCRKLLAGYLDKYDDVESIGVTGAMHGILYTDKEGCKSAVYMAGSKWRSDKSGKWKELCKRIVRDHRLCNGNRFWSYNTLLQYETSFNSKRSGIFLYNSGLCRFFDRTGERTITSSKHGCKSWDL